MTQFKPTYRYQPRPPIKPPVGFVDTEKLQITADGRWLSNNEEVTHERMLELYWKSLYCDDAGYYLRVGKEVKAVDVEDTAYFVKSVSGDEKSGFEMALTDGTREQLDLKTLKYEPGRLIAPIKSGGERARFLRAPYHEILLKGAWHLKA